MPCLFLTITDLSSIPIIFQGRVFVNVSVSVLSVRLAMGGRSSIRSCQGQHLEGLKAEFTSIAGRQRKSGDFLLNY